MSLMPVVDHEDWDAEAETDHVVNTRSNNECTSSLLLVSSLSQTTPNSLNQFSDSSFEAITSEESSTVDEKRHHRRYNLVPDDNKNKVFVSNINFKVRIDASLHIELIVH